jgi:hypothetical protein
VEVLPQRETWRQGFGGAEGVEKPGAFGQAANGRGVLLGIEVAREDDREGAPTLLKEFHHALGLAEAPVVWVDATPRSPHGVRSVA